jgi:hypothetical protein
MNLLPMSRDIGVTHVARQNRANSAPFDAWLGACHGKEAGAAGRPRVGE